MSNLQVGTIMPTTANVATVGSYNYPTSDSSFAATYDEAILRANALDVNLESYMSMATGKIPKYVVPYDLSHSTDYTTTLATPERLATTDYYNSLFGFGGGVVSSAIGSNTANAVENSNETVANAQENVSQEFSAKGNISAIQPTSNMLLVESEKSEFVAAKIAVQNWQKMKADLSYSQWNGTVYDVLRKV